MKISNFILTFILALAVSFTVQSQSNSVREIKVNNDDESIYIKYEDGELSHLEIDGAVIDKNDFHQYKRIIKKYQNSSAESVTPPTPPATPHTSGTQQELHTALRKFLLDNTTMDDIEYEFKLTPQYIKVDGKKQSKHVLTGCLEIFQKVKGSRLSKGSYFHADISPNSKSVSLSIQD